MCPQYLWFRHTFVLTAEQAAELRGLAVAALADRKLEVGELAASTLSGMLKVGFLRVNQGASLLHAVSVSSAGLQAFMSGWTSARC